ncbi:Ribosomal Protein Small subunit [Fasciolopsis buskii]|uniref:Small ribosomal subunit protein uS10 n=1 Tax=Fasciolopsis buskii TaxID=27845 RepID=A0A8E0RL20_9TREM|nr:Ribosomal Protein Small subunit [Fasciolopsis buski]
MAEKKPEVPQISGKNWVRITLTAASVKPLEVVSADLIKRAKDQNLRVKGPVRMPTKVLRITTRKTPCGEGSKTWDRFQMRIHKRVIDLLSTDEAAQQLKQIYLEPGVYCDVKVAGDA